MLENSRWVGGARGSFRVWGGSWLVGKKPQPRLISVARNTLPVRAGAVTPFLDSRAQEFGCIGGGVTELW